MSVADTTALLAVLDVAHPHHEEAKNLLADGPIGVSWGSLAEVTQVTWRLARESGQDGTVASRRAMAALRGHPSFRLLAEPDLATVAQLYSTHRKLSFVDAWNLAAARATGEPLVTFDRDLKAAQRRAGAG